MSSFTINAKAFWKWSMEGRARRHATQKIVIVASSGVIALLESACGVQVTAKLEATNIIVIGFSWSILGMAWATMMLEKECAKIRRKLGHSSALDPKRPAGKAREG